MRIKNSPYNLRESLGYLKRNVLGPVTKNKGIVSYCPQSCDINSGITPEYKLGFIGDIMDMAGRSLVIGDKIKGFISDCDYLVGNFEATITDRDGPPFSQKHITQILDALETFFSPDRTFLSLANNHSGDFGFGVWSRSKAMIQERGFQIFGTPETPYVEIESKIRIVGVTNWSNQPVDYICKFKDATKFAQTGRFNILYPHWNYEMELFPRPVIVKQGMELSVHYDAVIGHHSHTPQPITITEIPIQSGPSNQLLAYGLGDFCIFEKLRHYLYGQVIKLDIGSQKAGKLKAGHLEWRFTTCQELDEKHWVTDLTDAYPYALE